jgi:hypothetical protein
MPDFARMRLHRRRVLLNGPRDVVPRGEVAPIGGQNDHLDGVVVEGAVEGVVDVEDHLRIDGIVLVGTRQHDARYVLHRMLVTDRGFW